jgi:hypothetical protein
VIVILAASWMWYFVANGQLDLVGALGTANRGELVQPPRQAQDAGWRWPTASLRPRRQTPPRWTLVVPQPGRLRRALRTRLFETRQIHMALGKEMGRVERAWSPPADGSELGVDALSDERPLPGRFAAYLATEQRGLTCGRATEPAFEELFPSWPPSRTAGT